MLFDVGDTFSDTIKANLTKWRLQLSLMNYLNYDAMCPGNHDIDYGDEELKEISSEAEFPILAANLLYKKNSEPYLGTPYLFKTINGLKTGIYGLTYHLTPETTSKKNIENVKYTLDFYQIQRDMKHMRQQGAELIIVLSHLGNEVDEKLAKEVEGIYIILGAHSHDPIPVKKAHNTVISQSTSHLTGLGYLELMFGKKELLSCRGKIIPIISEKIKEDADVKSKIRNFEREHRHMLFENIGYSQRAHCQKLQERITC